VKLSPVKLRKIVREERLESFLKKHLSKKSNEQKEDLFCCKPWDYIWTEEELEDFTTQDNTSFSIKTFTK